MAHDHALVSVALPMVAYCDSTATIALLNDTVHHSCTKHIAVQYLWAFTNGGFGHSTTGAAFGTSRARSGGRQGSEENHAPRMLSRHSERRAVLAVPAADAAFLPSPDLTERASSCFLRALAFALRMCVSSRSCPSGSASFTAFSPQRRSMRSTRMRIFMRKRFLSSAAHTCIVTQSEVDRLPQ